METTMLPTMRLWSVPATSMTGRLACIGGTTAPHAGAYSTSLPVVPAAAGKNAAASFGADASGTADAFVPAAGRQADADARTVTTLDPGSTPREHRLL